MTNFNLTSQRGFAFGGEDDKTEALCFLAVEGDVKGLMVQNAGHWDPGQPGRTIHQHRSHALHLLFCHVCFKKIEMEKYC